QRSDDGYEKPCCRNGLVQPLLPLLTEFNSVDVLKDVELAIAGDDLDAKFEQAPQRSNRTAKEFIVQSRVAEEGFGAIIHCLIPCVSSSSALSSAPSRPASRSAFGNAGTLISGGMPGPS